MSFAVQSPGSGIGKIETLPEGHRFGGKTRNQQEILIARIHIQAMNGQDVRPELQRIHVRRDIQRHRIARDLTNSRDKIPRQYVMRVVGRTRRCGPAGPERSRVGEDVLQIHGRRQRRRLGLLVRRTKVHVQLLLFPGIVHPQVQQVDARSRLTGEQGISIEPRQRNAGQVSRLARLDPKMTGERIVRIKGACGHGVQLNRQKGRTGAIDAQPAASLSKDVVAVRLQDERHPLAAQSIAIWKDATRTRTMNIEGHAGAESKVGSERYRIRQPCRARLLRLSRCQLQTFTLPRGTAQQRVVVPIVGVGEIRVVDVGRDPSMRCGRHGIPGGIVRCIDASNLLTVQISDESVVIIDLQIHRFKKRQSVAGDFKCAADVRRSGLAAHGSQRPIRMNQRTKVAICRIVVIAQPGVHPNPACIVKHRCGPNGGRNILGPRCGKEHADRIAFRHQRFGDQPLLDAVRDIRVLRSEGNIFIGDGPSIRFVQP